MMTPPLAHAEECSIGADAELSLALAYLRRGTAVINGLCHGTPTSGISAAWGPSLAEANHALHRALIILQDVSGDSTEPGRWRPSPTVGGDEDE